MSSRCGQNVEINRQVRAEITQFNSRFLRQNYVPHASIQIDRTIPRLESGSLSFDSTILPEDQHQSRLFSFTCHPRCRLLSVPASRMCNFRTNRAECQYCQRHHQGPLTLSLPLSTSALPTVKRSQTLRTSLWFHIYRESRNIRSWHSSRQHVFVTFNSFPNSLMKFLVARHILSVLMFAYGFGFMTLFLSLLWGIPGIW